MIKQLQEAINHILLGKEEVVRLAITCLLADGHLLLEDIPGMGKTTLSQALAYFIGMEYQRIQFTSDLLPSDVLGVSVFNDEQKKFQFHKGPIFSQLILCDEINRATPKTQSALLEAMEERQVTVDSKTLTLPSPFFVIATQNPIYQTGTYPLPESQLDRFLMRITIGYPPPEAERKLLRSNNSRADLFAQSTVTNAKQLQRLQQKVREVTVSDLMLDYVQALLYASRSHDWFNHGLSPRAGNAIIRSAQAYALIDTRNFIRPDDVQAILPAVVNHRLIIRQSENQLTPAALLLEAVEVPI